MKTSVFSALARARLQMQFWLARSGWSKAVAGTLCAAGAIGWLVAIPRLSTGLSAQQTAFTVAQQSLKLDAPMAVMSASPNKERWGRFHAALGEKRQVGDALNTLFATAKKNGIAVAQADYRAAENLEGRFHTYRISLPVRGSYGAIRAFSQDLLLAIPFSSLDELSFKRDTIANSMVEGKLILTLYLSDLPREQATTPVRGPGSSS